MPTSQLVSTPFLNEDNTQCELEKVAWQPPIFPLCDVNMSWQLTQIWTDVSVAVDGPGVIPGARQPTVTGTRH